MALHCPECGFNNSDGANFCQKCGAHLVVDERGGDQTTITYVAVVTSSRGSRVPTNAPHLGQ